MTVKILAWVSPSFPDGFKKVFPELTEWVFTSFPVHTFLKIAHYRTQN